MEALAGDGVPTKIAHLAVKGLPTSGKPEELMNAAGISARHIVAAATKLLQSK
jgi:transketolase